MRTRSALQTWMCGIAVSGQVARGSQEAPTNPSPTDKLGDLLNFGEALMKGCVTRASNAEL